MYFLIVEDAEKTAEQLRRGLSEMSVTVDVASDGLKGLAMARERDYDLIVLDLMLPGIDGFEVVKRLREGGSTTPVMILTARDEVHDRITGLQLGADDYLVKPYSFAELCARVQALLRRGQVVQQDEIQVADLTVNFFAHKATRAGKNLELTPKEFALLSLLIRRAGEVQSRLRIAERVWNLGFDANLKIVDVKVAALRAKVDGPYEKKLIHTVRGLGYILEDR
ncbi:heavy metal transcriptional response regulator CusR [Citrifermentans bemidjiense Bem]|uniref:Heavy metal transcriptional response regulator CusR n=1 Tax=Citrifermentans bemidjiense (strain ATCC BAA-1014 / DSM 16622 / JCM 12645 / Bem) TaxID=404380 RepID=B5EC02_CITBB|nr:heavy metal response regulator transcription factor [Citrifermentans bemidjiense]ACH40458.1 heavy metal transcriptional response regulator CusR [Citrifermentans bemidjiense Bem]